MKALDCERLGRPDSPQAERTELNVCICQHEIAADTLNACL